jgi:DNA-binding NtrC family response regulator
MMTDTTTGSATGIDNPVSGLNGTLDVPDLLEVDAAEKASLRILVVDDDRTLRESCAKFLETEGYQVTLCRRGDEALDLLKRQRFDIVLLDLYMSGVPGMELLKTALTRHPETVVIVMTGHPSIQSSIEALRTGAWDYLPKPFSATHLQVLVGRAAHSVIVGRETQELHAELARQHGNSEKVTVLGTSAAFRRVIEMARRVAPTDASVFLTGESGTGKELIAQFIHSHSRRDSRQLVAINCAAIPETLLETEMFGHRKGAFTGAVEDKQGLLEAANGGTLFLDELTQMPPAIQAKLLRVIQDGVVRRVGSDTVNAVVNVRFIAATNTSPEDAIRAGDLREDLYYRLRVVPIHLPPLRERREDIPLLANYFLRHYWNRHREAGTPAPTLGEGAIAALQAHAWRGNVRELQNIIEHGVVLFAPGSEVRPDDIPFDTVSNGGLHAGHPTDIEPFQSEAAEQGFHAARDKLLAQFERRYLTWLVNRAGGNMSRAARIAGVDRTTLYRLMDKHGLQRETIMVPSD